MATYNFTVRATDNVGAFSDRSFSLNVQKTRVHRFAVQTPVGFLLSTNGDDWRFEQDVTTAVMAYGNGTWVGSPTVTSVRVSQDGRNWTTKTFPALPRYVNGTSATVTNIKYIGGKWYLVGAVYFTSTGNYTPALWVSDDNMASWELQSRPTLLMTTAATPISDFDHDPATGTTVLYTGNLTGTPHATQLTRGIFTKVGDGAWVAAPIGTADTLGIGSVNFVNGLWTIASGSRFVWVSRDGLNWMARAPGANAIGNVVSCNGLLVASQTPTTNINTGLMVSSDAGYTWTQKPVFALPAQYNNTARHLAEYNGTIVMTGFGAQQRQFFIYTTKNMGETWSTYSTQTLTGSSNIISQRIVSRND